MMEMMQMVRGFINLIKANPTTREQYKSNKLAARKYDNEVNESDIHTNSLDQVQQFFNEDMDVVFEALVAADYCNSMPLVWFGLTMCVVKCSYLLVRHRVSKIMLLFC